MTLVVSIAHTTNTQRARISKNNVEYELEFKLLKLVIVYRHV